MVLLEANAQPIGHLLSIVTFLPALGALLLCLLKRERESEIKAGALFASLVTAAASLLLIPGFAAAGGFQHVESLSWIPAFNIKYSLGVDGLALVLVLLTTFMTPVVMASGLYTVHKRVKEYFIAMLVLETGMIGAFCATDLFLFYVFFEVMLIPMYLLIGVWGGSNRLYAAVKFFIYTLVGSLLMFVAILYCYHVSGLETFSIPMLTERLPEIWREHPSAAALCFGAFMLSFAIKTPLFPLHTWLPDAHTEAPTGGSVMLAAVMLKFGTYGMLRFGIGFFPQQAVDYAPLLVALAVIGIVYGALMALAQEDLKKLVAYSSVSHLGFVVLGLFAFNTIAVQGAVLQMLNHGLSTGLLFLLVGAVYERRHTRLIEEYGGLAKVMPRFAVLFMITTLASIGLPGLNGFWGEFLILLGSFGALHREGAAFAWNFMNTATLIAGTGVILGAIYMLWAYQRVFFGKVTRKENAGLKDLSRGEMGYLLPVVAGCFLIGIQPRIVLDVTEPSVRNLVEPAHILYVERYVPAAPVQMAGGAGPAAHTGAGPSSGHTLP